jgi:HEAT repeat protein
MPVPGQLKQVEDKLCGFLESGVSPAAKDAASRELGLIATERSVPALSRLLAHRETAEIARRIRERIPGDKADTTLRKALLSSYGDSRIGIINTLAMRGDSRAVPQLRRLMDAGGVESQAAIMALGSIATPAAVQALKAARNNADARRRSAVSRALLASAERFQERGESCGAAEIYRDLLAVSQQETVTIPALRGLTAAGSPEAMPAITRMLAGENPHAQTAVLQILSQMPGPEITTMIINRLRSLPSERTAAQTVALLAEAMKLATQPEEKKSIVTLLPN